MADFMRKRMKNKTLWIIFSPVLIVLTVTILTVTIVMNHFALSMDTYLGKGARSVIVPEGREKWDANYYTQLYNTFEGESGSQVNAGKVAQRISDEGIVLLKNKNNTLPLAPNSTVTPFGHRYMKPVYGGEGSGSTGTGGGYFVLLPEAVAANFKVNPATVGKMSATTAEKMGEAPGTIECDSGTSESGADTTTFIFEYNPGVYQGTEASCSGTTGLVFIGRAGGESGDFKFDGYTDGTPHQLTLSENEKGMVRFAKKNCDKTVAVINTANPMELDILMKGEMEVDAILWVGITGARGFMSMSNILCGKTVPSGKTVDTYAVDFMKDPTYVNFGNFEYSNLNTLRHSLFSAKPITAKFVEYEENVYIGYKYYETAAAMDSSFVYGDHVLFPFGYGLSYVDNDGGFTQEIVSYSDSGSTIELSVKVKNNSGKDAGKDVVQVYFTAPYTDFDISYKIEKPAVNLIAFAKTGVIAPGKTDTVKISFDKEDMASYCYTVKNPDGTRGAYVLEEGAYGISVRSDSHNAIETKTWNNPSTVWYNGFNMRQSEKDAQSALDEKGNPTGIPAKAMSDPQNAAFQTAVNMFEDSTAYMNGPKVTTLSRSNWKGTFPTAPTEADRVADQEVIYIYENYSSNTFDYATNPLLGNVPGSKVYTNKPVAEKQNNGLTLADLRGYDFHDENWDLLLDQIDYDNQEQLISLLFAGIYRTGALDSVGLPETLDQDGPQGLSLFVNKKSWCAYSAQIVLASTWNVELSKEFGYSIGQEMLLTGSSGWYAPGLNVHRSPFGGRVYEYYSEDSVLSGYMATGTVEGAGECGVYTFMKHFALNDQETNRHNGSVWANEQAIREVYLKPFEMVVKNAKAQMKYISDNAGTVSVKTIRCATAMMTGRNRIGAMPAGSHYNLITEVLRGEWGFNGIVETDIPSQVDFDAQLRAGSDIVMSLSTSPSNDMTSNTAKNCIRRAVHNVCYAVVNSNAMQGATPGSIIRYGMSPWAVWLLAANIVIYDFVVITLVFLALRTRDAKKRPEKYRR